jgi:2,4-dienoyl-CoA reductase-like NADH-dependent reductase (Old Yellow Enzyme family)
LLFTPFQLGSQTLKNRLVALPVFSGYALPDGRASELLIDHYTTLAHSGVAMVVVANAAVAADWRKRSDPGAQPLCCS